MSFYIQFARLIVRKLQPPVSILGLSENPTAHRKPYLFAELRSTWPCAKCCPADDGNLAKQPFRLPGLRDDFMQNSGGQLSRSRDSMWWASSKARLALILFGFQKVPGSDRVAALSSATVTVTAATLPAVTLHHFEFMAQSKDESILQVDQNKPRGFHDGFRHFILNSKYGIPRRSGDQDMLVREARAEPGLH